MGCHDLDRLPEGGGGGAVLVIRAPVVRHSCDTGILLHIGSRFCLQRDFSCHCNGLILVRPLVTIFSKVSHYL